jgi:K+-transporting ATPase KdpF subunit
MCVVAKSYSEESYTMSLETILTMAVSALLLIYLVYALLRPEKF